MTPLLDGAARTVGAVPGALLAGGLLLTAHLRHDKPLHPLGVVGDGTLTVPGGGTCGVPLLDTAGTHPVLARWSRAVGHDGSSRDVEGLAVRVLDLGAPADVLLASTGDGVLTRHLLALRAPGEHATVTTLLPVATERGSLLLRLEPTGAAVVHGRPPAAYALSWARVGGAWHACGSLEVAWRDEDEDVRFDPVLNLLPGTRQYPLVAALREPSYRGARTVRPPEG